MLEDTYSIGKKGILATLQNPLITIASHKKQRGQGVLSPAGNLLYNQQPSWFFLTQSVFLYRVIILSSNYCHLLLACLLY